MTIEEIRESEQRSLELCEQVDDVFRHAGFYDAKADELDIQAITSSIRKIDGVLSANLEESRKMITVMKKDSTIIHFDFDDSAYYEEDSEGDTKSLYSQIKELALRQSNTKSSSTTKKALLLSPFQNSFWVKGQQMGNFHINETEIQDLLRPLGYTLKFLPDEQASLSMFTLDYMADYDLVMIISHGGGLDQWFGTTVISGSYNYTTDNKPELYRLSESYVSIGSIPRYGINPKWLELTYGGTKRFNNSIIYIGSCHSYDVDDMKDVFMQHGAAAYFGFVGEIPFLKKVFNVTAELMYSVIRSLCRGMDASAAYDFIHLDKDLQSAIFGLIQSTWDIDNFRVNPETKENFVFLADPRPKELKADVKGNSATLTWKCDYVFDDCKYMVHTDGRNFWLDPALNPSVSVPFDNPGTYPWSVVTNIYARTTTSDEPEIVTTYRTNGEDFTVKEQNATPEAIDLGLPSGIKWASFNLGATKPEEYGDYFAWGEMEAKSKYDWSTYIWSNGSYSSLTKYYSDDGKVSLDIEDDAAHKKLGSSWHVPTDSDWRELIKYCNWTPTTRNGIDGMLVTSKTTRATLFLPFAGQKDRTFMEDVGTVGYYWTSSLYPYAPCACVGVTSPEIGEIDRCMGIPIRPVFGDSSSGDSNENQGVVDLGLSVKWGTCNLGASKPEEYGDYYAWGETDFYYLEGHAYDNPCNDWKEGKSSGYGGGSYKWYDYSNNTLTLLKYNLDPSLGIVDGKTVLDPEDDAAHVKLGEKWRIPTDNDWVDLCFYCTLTWTTENGVKGIKMTSKKVGYTGRSIFLPAGGSRYDYELYRIGEKGCYWTSTLDYRSVFASSWDFETLNSMNPSNIPRDLGILIRPVYDDK